MLRDSRYQPSEEGTDSLLTLNEVEQGVSTIWRNTNGAAGVFPGQAAHLEWCWSWNDSILPQGAIARAYFRARRQPEVGELRGVLSRQLEGQIDANS